VALVIVTDAAAAPIPSFGIAARSQVVVVDASAAAIAIFDVAISSLVIIADTGAATIPNLDVTCRTKVVIFDVSAAAIAVFDVAICALVIVIDTAATSIGKAAKYQQQYAEKSHHTLPNLPELTQAFADVARLLEPGKRRLPAAS
jgi:hypothetical protein